MIVNNASLFWSDQIAQKIIASGKYKPYHVNDMKTPSGRIHVGSLRGVVIHDLLYQALRNQNKPAVFSYCINDMDPMDGFPVYLDRKKFFQYMGWPLYKIPSPQKGFSSFSQCYAQEFIEVFNKIGCQPEIVWTSKLYQEGKFDAIIKTCLDSTEKIRRLFKEQYPSFKREDYFPYQPICPQCGKINTTKISQWDGKEVYFECKENGVSYTKGCGYKGKIKPEKQNGKMPWKIEWAVHWQVLGITIEWAGKDHMTQGGAHEISAKISEQILKYPTPQAELYEHILVGGQKMSSSKGRGSSAKEMAAILPAEILRFLLVRTHYRKTIDFNPSGNTIPDLFDDYDSFARQYYKEEKSGFGRIWQLSQVQPIPSKPVFLPRFRDVVNLLQNPAVNIEEQFAKIKGSALTSEDKKELTQRIKYAKLWLKNYAPEASRVGVIAEKVKIVLSEEQKKYLISLISLISQKKWQPDDLQQALYEAAKKNDFNPQKCFQAIYLALTGKPYGPKAAWLILDQDQEFIINRFKEVVK